MVTKQLHGSDVFSRYSRIILQMMLVNFFMSQRNRFMLKSEFNQRLPLMKSNVKTNSVGTRTIFEICYEFFLFFSAKILRSIFCLRFIFLTTVFNIQK